MQATEEVIDILLRSVDVLRGLLDADADADMPAAATELDARIEALIPSVPAAEEAAPPAQAPSAEPAAEIKLFAVEFRPDRELFSSGTNPIVLLRNLAALGTVSRCHLHAEDLPALADLDPSQCYLSWTIELASAAPGDGTARGLRVCRTPGGNPYLRCGGSAAARLRFVSGIPRQRWKRADSSSSDAASSPLRRTPQALRCGSTPVCA